ncbi:MAG: hypothetical protein AB4426_08010 [Xenococcaceae cyanobacterium]
MQKEFLQDYVSPTTGSPLELVSVEKSEKSKILEGTLQDISSGELFPIRNAIPRFVEGDNYADNFGMEWNRFRQVQLDSVNGSTLTRDRFY